MSTKIEFLNLQELVSQELLHALQKTPHMLKDAFGNVLSQMDPHALSSAEADIFLSEDMPIGCLRTSSDERDAVTELVESSIRREFSLHEAQHKIIKNEILANDLEELLRLSDSQEIKFEAQLKHFLQITRSYFCAKEAGIFGIQDGFTLDGLAHLHPEGSQSSDWKLLYSAPSGVAVSSKKIFSSHNPSFEKSFKGFHESELPKNFFCVPLMQGEVPIGTLYITNKFSDFEKKDQLVLERFATVAVQILQKNYLKKRAADLVKTSDHLGKYISSKVLQSVKKADAIELGGVEKRVVCLFSDIRSFTTITEGKNAVAIVKLLNFYFERMDPIIEKYEGTLDKIVGDMLMVVWNIPHDQPEPELLAMKCALEMQKEMIRVVSPVWERYGIPKVGMGIGINAGMAVAGNLGSNRFMNYTVVGDTINTAQRLESKAKAGEIWMADSMFSAVDGKIQKPDRRETEIKLKGKDRTMNAYVYKPLSY